MTGHDLSLEGAAMVPILYPDPMKHREARPRLRRRYRKLLHSGDPFRQAVGFFLFGLAGDLGGTHA
jgi:hypothetical protein